MITIDMVNKAREKNIWTKGNEILYDLCMNKYPLHVNESEIISKVWLIGRSYAAAIERTKNKIYQDIYTDAVGPIFIKYNKKNAIDHKLSSVSSNLTKESLAEIIKIHYIFTEIFYEISEMKKRSLASKYLHFHKPDLFFIYDSKACDSLRNFSKITGRISGDFECDCDEEYRKFAEKCFALREHIFKKFNIYLTPREIDNLLLHMKID